MNGDITILDWWSYSHIALDWELVVVLSLSLRYLDNVVNKQTVSPPIPHLHALLTSGDEPPPEIDVFQLIKSSYDVRQVLPAWLVEPNDFFTENSILSSWTQLACLLNRIEQGEIDVDSTNQWLRDTFVTDSIESYFNSIILQFSNTCLFPLFLCVPEQKFGSLRADVIEQMRFKQRLKVIQSLEDTAKRSVVSSYVKEVTVI